MRTGSAQQLAALIGLPNLAIEGVIGDLSLKLSNFNDLQIRNDLLARSSLVESARVDIARTQFLLRRTEVEPIPNLTVNSGYQYATAGTHFTGAGRAVFRDADLGSQSGKHPRGHGERAQLCGAAQCGAERHFASSSSGFGRLPCG